MKIQNHSQFNSSIAYALLKFILVCIPIFLLISCVKNDDAPENNVTVFKGKVENDNGEVFDNEWLFVVRENNIYDRTADSTMTDENGNYYLEIEDNEYSTYTYSTGFRFNPTVPGANFGFFFPDARVYQSSTASIYGNPIEAVNEDELTFERRNTFKLTVNKANAESDECLIFLGDLGGFSLEELNRTFRVNDQNAVFLDTFLQTKDIELTFIVYNAADEILEQETTLIEPLQNTPMEYSIEY